MGRCGIIKRKKRGGSFKISPIQKMKKLQGILKVDWSAMFVGKRACISATSVIMSIKTITTQSCVCGSYPQQPAAAAVSPAVLFATVFTISSPHDGCIPTVSIISLYVTPFLTHRAHP